MRALRRKPTYPVRSRPRLAIADTTPDTRAVGGPPIPIEGDGRVSWGPQKPG